MYVMFYTLNNKSNSKFDFIIYNAGTDIMIGDRLGNLKIRPEDIITRDEMVFNFAKEKDVPIVMVLSGGYQKANAKNIADSIQNLHNLFRILG